LKKSTYIKIAKKAALKAGSYILKRLGKIREVRYKGEINVVTDVDKKAERIIINAISSSFPSHTFLAEENTQASSNKSSDFKWIIDPLDGTTNFLHSFPVFCVSIALEHKGEIILGVVYDPSQDELFYAEKNKGAFLNNKRIRVSKVKQLKKALLATGFAYNVGRARNNNIDNFVNFIKNSQAIRRAGSAAIDLCYVACGRFDGFWELYLKPWDTAAGVLIVEEAGGKITKLDGLKYSVYAAEILASNSKIHSKMLKILSKSILLVIKKAS